MTENLQNEVDYSVLDKFNVDEVELEAPINWNDVDPWDMEIWNKLVGNFWVPEAVPVSLDIPSWETLTPAEKETTAKVFAGLTLLDSIQGKVGAISLIPDSITPHEEAIYTNIAFMEMIHAKSYSSIFSTLLSSPEINDVFRWSREDEFLKRKQAIILHYYRGDDPEKRKIASTMLESFLFYSGFFMPLYWASKGKLTNTASIIALIIRDEAVHGYFIAGKFQQAYRNSSEKRQKELYDFTIELMNALYANEVLYAESLYDQLGLTEYVKTFLKYNANKALSNLGFEPLFNKDETEVLPQIISSLSPANNENHDFFSQKSVSYVKAGGGANEETEDSDWNF